MQIETNKATRAALCVQYEVLQTRIGLHGGRLWQLPFTYVSFSAIATPVALGNADKVSLPLFFGSLSCVGFLVVLCMFSAWRGYRRTGRNMNEVETRLGIEAYTKFGAWHAAPYFSLMAYVVVGFAILAVAYTGQSPVSLNG